MSDPIFLKTALDTAIRAALAAGEAIMRVYAEPFEVMQKSDQTPVTEADLASERVIVKMLAEAFPDIPIVSEETAPEDGFKPYAAHGPGTAIRIKDGGAAEKISARAPGPDGLAVIHSRTNNNSRRLAEYFQGRSILERISCGSALKFGVLAAGEADLYPRFGTTMEWDTAAGQAILEAAGGSVVRVEGGPLAYGKHDLKNDAFLAWGRNPAW
jgi:3'(2'), 5'-bisphosphate nucleotidase